MQDGPAPPAFKWSGNEADRALFPIQHHDIWAFRKRLDALVWNAQEVDLTADKQHWDQMEEPYRDFVKMQLAFFARIDIDVLANVGENLSGEVGCLEAKLFYAAQQNQEAVHAESYGLQIEAVMHGDERAAVFNAVRSMPVIARMRDWVLRWFDRSIDIGERLVAFAAVEGVLFSASFSALQWLRELKLLPGITTFNEFIVRDEGIHTLFTCLLVRKYLRVRPPQARAQTIFESIIAVLDDFIRESLPGRLAGMNSSLMMKYVRFQADSVLSAMNYATVFHVSNPFGFMEKLTLNAVAKTNFFESRPTQYQSVVTPDQARFAIDESPDESPDASPVGRI